LQQNLNYQKQFVGGCAMYITSTKWRSSYPWHWIEKVCFMHGSSAFQWKTTYLRKREVNNAELRHKHLQHNWYTLTCLNRFRWMTRISGNDHSPSFFTTSCLRLQFGQCHASSAPNTSARVYNWSDKTFVCVMNMKNYWYHYTKQLKGWERHYSQEHVFF